tara:strand:+ start:419 stop:553 length:135 start_codon:yes stop_codon:yes gene_type:complete
MAIYKEKPAIEVHNRPIHPITTDEKTKVRAVVTSFITHMKAALG